MGAGTAVQYEAGPVREIAHRVSHIGPQPDLSDDTHANVARSVAEGRTPAPVSRKLRIGDEIARSSVMA